MTRKISPSKDAPLVAPFPWFGGKKNVAAEVWERFGNPDNYVEPFGGSLAVLLARPNEHVWWEKKETAGDFSGHVVNFFRAVSQDPEKVATYASYPITEADLTARHLYLVRYENDLAEKLAADPKFCDFEAAGWWVWGISAWVGGDWMSGMGPWKPGQPEGPGVYRKLPMVAGSHGGKGIHKPIKNLETEEDNAPNLIEAYEEHLKEEFIALSNRLRRVRLTCGDWKRLTKSAADAGAKKVTAIFLDPPYDPTLRRNELYGSSDTQVEGKLPPYLEARTWALENGTDPYKRIAYCSYSTPEEDKLFTDAGWTPYRWSAQGGYGLQSSNAARHNKDLEIIWFSPACLKPEAKTVDTVDAKTSLF